MAHLLAIIAVVSGSLYPKKEKLEENSSYVFIEILDILQGITNPKYLHLILKFFFQSQKRVDAKTIFNVDNMFLLLMN